MAKWRDKSGDVEHGAQNVSASEFLDTFTEEYTEDTGAIAAVALVTPASGKKVGVYSISITTDSTSGEIVTDFLTSGIKLSRVYPARNVQSPALDHHIVGAADEVVTFSATGLSNGAKVFISMKHLEHD